MTTIMGIIVAVLMIWLLLKILKTPLKWVWKLLINAAGGFISLFVLNFLGGFVGLSLEITWLNAIVVGILGLPGVLLLLLIKYI